MVLMMPVRMAERRICTLTTKTLWGQRRKQGCLARACVMRLSRPSDLRQHSSRRETPTHLSEPGTMTSATKTAETAATAASLKSPRQYTIATAAAEEIYERKMADLG